MSILLRISILLVALAVVSHTSFAQGGGLPGAGEAMQFGGTDFINIGTWSPGSQWTLEAWVMPLTTGNATIVGSRNTDCQDWALAIQDGQYVVVFGRGVGDKTCIAMLSSGTSTSPGLWSYVVATDDGSNMNIYINGDLRGSMQLPASFTA